MSAGGLRVLVVGASADLRAALSYDRLMISQADSPEAVEVFSQASLDLLVLDGARWSFDLWRETRDAADLSRIPLLLVEDSFVERAEAYGATDIMKRPIDPAELLRRTFALAELGRWRRLDEIQQHTNALTADSSQFFDLILEELPTGVITTDEDHRITFVNRAGLQTLGSSGVSYLGAPMAGVLQLPPEIRIDPEGSRRYAYTAQRPDGRLVELGVTITPSELHPNIRCFVLFRDLTLTRETDLAARRVERLAAMGTMLTGFAHEVRNPLSAMHSLIELLNDETPTQDPRSGTLAKLLRHIDRIERLVRTSLKFGRPEEPRKSTVSAKRIGEDAIEQMRPKTSLLGEIRNELEEQLPDVEIDEQQITQALVALLTNALDAVGYPDQITLRSGSYSTPGGERGIFFEVRDFGPGIPNHVLGRIFDPFFTTKATGTGLGLSIAQRLIHDNGGRLEVSSTVGLGASFTVFLPSEIGVPS